ncbi:MAG: biotin--[acetyl-CoA-carboxylase] ligase [Thermodesulfobacteriota bacterium]
MSDPEWEQMLASGMLAGQPVRFLAETDSTNSVALGLAASGVSAGTLVVAERQSHGRGRLGRAWASPPGSGLYFSLILRPALAWADFPRITLAAGLGLCRAVEAIAGCQPGLKWPNDLYLNGRKCGGILTETGPLAGEERPAVVVGVGLNVNTEAAAFPEAVRDRAISLRMATGRQEPRGRLLAAIVAEVTARVRQMEQGEWGAVLAAWRQRDIHAGLEVAWVNSKGQVVRGISLGPDEEGLLHIRDSRGMVHAVLSGDVGLAER